MPTNVAAMHPYCLAHELASYAHKMHHSPYETCACVRRAGYTERFGKSYNFHIIKPTTKRCCNTFDLFIKYEKHDFVVCSCACGSNKAKSIDAQLNIIAQCTAFRVYLCISPLFSLWPPSTSSMLPALFTPNF